MTLTQIDQRLSLFGKYLEYRIDAKFTQIGFTFTPEYILRMFEQHGFLINMREIGVPLLSFDQWLHLNKRADLAEEVETIIIGTNPMMQVVKYGGREYVYDIIGSSDFFKNWDVVLSNYFN